MCTDYVWCYISAYMVSKDQEIQVQFPSCCLTLSRLVEICTYTKGLGCGFSNSHDFVYTEECDLARDTHHWREYKQREQAWQTGSFQLPWSYARFCHQTVLKVFKSPDEGLEVGRRAGRWGDGEGRRKRSEAR